MVHNGDIIHFVQDLAVKDAKSRRLKNMPLISYNMPLISYNMPLISYNMKKTASSRINSPDLDLGLIQDKTFTAAHKENIIKEHDFEIETSDEVNHSKTRGCHLTQNNNSSQIEDSNSLDNKGQPTETTSKTRGCHLTQNDNSSQIEDSNSLDNKGQPTETTSKTRGCHLTQNDNSSQIEDSNSLDNKGQPTETTSKTRDCHLTQNDNSSQIEDSNSLDDKGQPTETTFPFSTDSNDDKGEQSSLTCDKETKKFVYLYQTRVQQGLLQRYGSILFIKEIVPKEFDEGALAVVMYLLAVRTNVDYQVVGTILMNECNNHTEVLKCTLSRFKIFNEFWNPKYLMIDPKDALISSIKELFPGL